MTPNTSIYEYAKQGLALSADKPAIWFYGKSMTYAELFYRIDNEKDIKEGYMRIKEPLPSKDRLVDCNEGLIIVPGVAFDKKCNRTGYGKGFYDRYLTKHRGLIKIGLGFSFQVFDELETDSYDIPLDYVITEDNIYKSGDI